MSDKRRHTRYEVAIAGEVEIDGDILPASADNLSRGGVGVIVERGAPEGSTVQVTLFLTQDGIEDPDEEPFEAKSAVRWAITRDDGMHVLGLQFANVTEAGQQHLDRFLAAVAE